MQPTICILGKKWVSKNLVGIILVYFLPYIANTVLRNTTGYRGREIHHSVPVIEFLQKKRLHFCKRFCDPGGTRTLDPMIKSHLLYQLSYGVDFLNGTGAKVTLFEKPANDYSKKFLATTIFDTPANDPAIQDNHLFPKPHFPNPFFPTLQTYKAPMGDYG